MQTSHCIFWLGASWCYLNIGHLHPKLKKGLISYHHESTKWKFRTIISWACQIRNGCCFLFLCDIKEQTTFLSPDRDWKHINKRKNGRRIFFDLKKGLIRYLAKLAPGLEIFSEEKCFQVGEEWKEKKKWSRGDQQKSCRIFKWRRIFLAGSNLVIIIIMMKILEKFHFRAQTPRDD